MQLGGSASGGTINRWKEKLRTKLRDHDTVLPLHMLDSLPETSRASENSSQGQTSTKSLLSPGRAGQEVL